MALSTVIHQVVTNIVGYHWLPGPAPQAQCGTNEGFRLHPSVTIGGIADGLPGCRLTAAGGPRAGQTDAGVERVTVRDSESDCQSSQLSETRH